MRPEAAASAPGRPRSTRGISSWRRGRTSTSSKCTTGSRSCSLTGPSTLDDLQTELGLKPKELKLLRAPLERCGALVSRSVLVELPDGRHAHTSELLRYDQAYPEPLGSDASIDDLVVAAVRAAVVAPEREVARKWFSWRWRCPDDLVDPLVAAGRIERPALGFVAVTSNA